MTGTGVKDQTLEQKISSGDHRVVGALWQELGAENNVYISYYFTNSVIIFVGGNNSQ